MCIQVALAGSRIERGTRLIIGKTIEPRLRRVIFGEDPGLGISRERHSHPFHRSVGPFADSIGAF